MSIQNYATSEMLQSIVKGETVPEKAATAVRAQTADRLAHALSIKVNGTPQGSFDGSEALELDLNTGTGAATAVVDRLAALPEATEESADIVGLDGQTCIKQKTGETYAYNSLIVRDTNKIAIGNSSTATALNSVAIGVQAMGTGGNSVSIGRQSAATLTEALAVGSGAQAKHMYTLAVGYKAIAESDNCIAFGKQANATASNAMAIGNGAVADTANTICLGNEKVAALNCQVALSVTSDERDKADVEEVNGEESLALIEKIKPVRYVNNHRALYAREGGSIGRGEYDKQAHARGDKKGNRKRVGVLAQQVQSVLSETFGTDNYADIVNDNLYDVPERSGEESLLTVRYAAFIPFLIGAVRELSEKVRKLEEKIVDKPAQL